MITRPIHQSPAMALVIPMKWKRTKYTPGVDFLGFVPSVSSLKFSRVSLILKNFPSSLIVGNRHRPSCIVDGVTFIFCCTRGRFRHDQQIVGNKRRGQLRIGYSQYFSIIRGWRRVDYNQITVRSHHHQRIGSIAVLSITKFGTIGNPTHSEPPTMSLEI